MQRRVEPELLDDLPPESPEAIHSRRDLRRINALMGHVGIACRALRPVPPPRRIVELGAGDGGWLLRVVERMAQVWPGGEITLVDQQDLLTPAMREKFARLGWRAEACRCDVFEWLAEPHDRADVTLANLFLHHFDGDRLRLLLAGVARQTRRFVACEPARSRLALNAARCLGIIGCNAVTRHDAVVSVRAGFAGTEISGAWPQDAGWKVGETQAGLFTRLFMATTVEGAGA